MLQLGRLDDVEQGEPPAGMSGAAGGIMHRDAMLRRLVDDDQEDTRWHALRHRVIAARILAASQTPRKGRLASHPATTAVSTAIAP